MIQDRSLSLYLFLSLPLSQEFLLSNRTKQSNNLASLCKFYFRERSSDTSYMYVMRAYMCYVQKNVHLTSSPFRSTRHTRDTVPTITTRRAARDCRMSSRSPLVSYTAYSSPSTQCFQIEHASNEQSITHTSDSHVRVSCALRLISECKTKRHIFFRLFLTTVASRCEGGGDIAVIKIYEKYKKLISKDYFFVVHININMFFYKNCTNIISCILYSKKIIIDT